MLSCKGSLPDHPFFGEFVRLKYKINLSVSNFNWKPVHRKIHPAQKATETTQNHCLHKFSETGPPHIGLYRSSPETDRINITKYLWANRWYPTHLMMNLNPSFGTQLKTWSNYFDGPLASFRKKPAQKIWTWTHRNTYTHPYDRSKESKVTA